jgi:hypothetical protein
MSLSFEDDLEDDEEEEDAEEEEDEDEEDDEEDVQLDNTPAEAAERRPQHRPAPPSVSVKSWAWYVLAATHAVAL